tara:strand:+ start:461 stop:673 length:213 start_codon:yes stop_codon:yes gene_type:complete
MIIFSGTVAHVEKFDWFQVQGLLNVVEDFNGWLSTTDFLRDKQFIKQCGDSLVLENLPESGVVVGKDGQL